MNMVGRPDVRCPSCGSHERQRMTYLFIKNQTDIFKEI